MSPGSGVTKCKPGQANCPRTSAEVISEDISGGSDVGGLYYLPDYGSITYTTVRITDVNGHIGVLADSWNLGTVTEIDQAGTQKQLTYGLFDNNDSFVTYWLNP